MQNTSLPNDDRRVLQAGFGLVDVMVAVTIASGCLLLATSTFGTRAPSVHPAAIALQASLAEARSIAAMRQADGTDGGLPTGATVSVTTDPANVGHSIITVYRSRPIANPNLSLTGATPITSNLPVDMAFPAMHVPAEFSVDQIGRIPVTGNFSILISSSGYSSIVSSAYVAGDPILTVDPSCSDRGTIVIASSATQSERHPFDCRSGIYEASVAG